MATKNPTSTKLTGQPDFLEASIEPEHPTKRSRVTNYVVAVALIIVALGLFRIFAWSFDNSPVIEVKNSPFPTRTIREHPTAGGVVFLDADFCKYKNLTGDLRISFVGPAREVFLPVAKETADTGCKKLEFPVLIPREIVPGEYKIKFRVTYDKNPLKQNEVVEFESQPVIIDPTTP